MVREFTRKEIFAVGACLSSIAVICNDGMREDIERFLMMIMEATEKEKIITIGIKD